MGDSVRRQARVSRLKWAAGAVGLLLVSLVPWALRQFQSQKDAAWQQILARGYFTVATDAAYPPFSAIDESGGMSGFDVDLAQAIAARWGVRAEFENITYDALPGTLIAGRDDMVISAYVPRPELARDIAFSHSYFVAGTVAVVRADSGGELNGDPGAWAAGKSFAVEYGAGGDALARRWARRVVGVTVLPQPTAAGALQVVEKGGADAALVDAVSAYEYLRDNQSLRIAGPPLEPEPYVIVVSARSKELLREVNMVLAAMEADGTLPEMRVKWLGEAAR